MSQQIGFRVSTDELIVKSAGVEKTYKTWAAVVSALGSKQNTVSLTTTGTSGNATFNAGTGVLNIPNYSAAAGAPGSVISVSSSNSAISVSDPTVNPVLTLTPRNINGVAYDGTANITIADATKEPIITTLGVTRGGTGLGSIAQGSILYTSATDVISALAKTATVSRYICNSGASNAPAWAQVNLTTGVIGTLPVANGGTGVATLTGIAKGNGTGVFTAAVAGTDYATPGSVAAKQDALTLTTTGTSGAATLIGSTLNIPNYATGSVSPWGSSGGVVTLNTPDQRVNLVPTNAKGLSVTTQTTYIGVDVTQTGSGRAIVGTNTGTGDALGALAGTGRAARFENNSTTNPALSVQNTNNNALGRLAEFNSSAGTQFTIENDGTPKSWTNDAGLVLRDSAGVFWKISVTTGGALTIALA